jgi:PAS domain S-box-containing protein
MNPLAKVNILVVDDQPAKLLSLQAILDPLGENVLQATCADEALKLLLAHEIAVVLVDVCMPGMDGFELAQMIREHPRYRRTAIIFISAVHLSDDDRLRGYGLGAVDYIPVPIIPDVLRAKVTVFAELFRKTEQLNAVNRDLERRVAERTTELEASNSRLRDSEQRYRQLVQGLPAAVYSCDEQGRITLFNDAAAALWGREPEVGRDIWCGSSRIRRPDGSFMPIADSPMAVALREGTPVRGQEIIIERPDGSRRHVLPYPEPILDAGGRIVGAINMLMDVTEQKEAQKALLESEAKFRMLADNMAQLAWMADGAGSVFWYNRRWFEFTGLSLDDSRDWGWTRTLHAEHAERVVDKIRSCFLSGEAWEDTFPTRAADGSFRWFLSRAFPVRDEAGAVVRWFGTGTDVTEQREAQQVLTRDRETLERLVAERTAELHRSNERLRLSERMATIGTLSAGLGHDIGNLLLPVRMRLDALDACALPEHAREDTEAIRKAVEYLQRLAGSLRLLALDTRTEESSDASTDLAAWWREAEGMIRNGVGHTIGLSADIPAGLPPLRLGKASLTQVVFNLVQNAGDALANRADGKILFTAARSSDQSIVLTVSDNGPGMTDEARRRCLEPFFTTKTRELSTGLGLPLVSAIIKRARGTLQVQSSPGHGASFRVELPVAQAPSTPSPEDAPRPRGVAIVSLRDPRLAAHVRSTLASLRFSIREGTAADDADLYVADASIPSALEQARVSTSAHPERKVVVFSHPGAPREEISRAVWLDSCMKLSEVRDRLAAAIAHAPEPALEHS